MNCIKIFNKKLKCSLYKKNPNKPIRVSITELKRYVGICVYSSVVKVPKVRDYWSTHLGFPPYI